MWTGEIKNEWSSSLTRLDERIAERDDLSIVPRDVGNSIRERHSILLVIPARRRLQMCGRQGRGGMALAQEGYVRASEQSEQPAPAKRKGVDTTHMLLPDKRKPLSIALETRPIRDLVGLEAELGHHELGGGFRDRGCSSISSC